MPQRYPLYLTCLLALPNLLGGCGAGAAPSEPRAAPLSFLPTDPIASEKPAVFLIRGLDPTRAGQAPEVTFDAFDGAPFLGGTAARITARAQPDGPGQIRGALPALEIPADATAVVEAGVTVRFADGVVIGGDALRARFVPVPKEAEPSLASVEPTLVLSGAPTPLLLHGRGFGDTGVRVAITLSATEGTPFQGGTNAAMSLPGTVATNDTVRAVLPAAMVTREALVQFEVAFPDGRTARSATALGRLARERLLSNSDALAFDHTGISVAIHGATVVVGACFADTPASMAGAADVHERSGGDWTRVQRLVAPEGNAGDEFGAAVAIDGDTLVIGAPYDDDAASNGGAVHVFTRAAGRWTHVQSLTASDAASGDHLGAAVSLHGDTLVAGAPEENNAAGTDAGAVYVFQRVAGQWHESQKLVTASVSARAQFGHAVALSADALLVGAPGEDLAFGFTKASGGFGSQQFLLAGEPVAGSGYGWSVALDGPRALVGAPDEGRAHAFERVSGTWTHRAALADPDRSEGFGWCVTLQDDIALCGAPFEGAGLVRPFRIQGDGTWTASAPVTAGDGAPNDAFGWSVAMHGSATVVGAPLDNNEGGTDAGAAYMK